MRERENAAILRDLNHTPGWELYKELARRYMDEKAKNFWRDNISADEAWNERLHLQAVKNFQAVMEDVVENAVDWLDPVKREEIELSFAPRDYDV